MHNGIQKRIVDDYVPSMKRSIEASFEIKVEYSQIEVIVLYDKEENVHTVNKDKTDSKRYPDRNLGKLLVRPFRDLKSSMFDHNGRIFIRFTYQFNGVYRQFTKELGIINEDNLIVHEDHKIF